MKLYNALLAMEPEKGPELQPGLAVFECRPTMEIETDNPVRVRVAQDRLEDIRVKLMQGLNKAFTKGPEPALIHLGMTAALRSDESVSIVETKALAQRMRGTAPNEWGWDVRPKSGGSHKLNVRVYALFESSELGKYEEDLYVDYRIVQVEVPWRYRLAQAIGRMDWLTSALLLFITNFLTWITTKRPGWMGRLARRFGVIISGLVRRLRVRRSGGSKKKNDNN
jgi:hypothetical protein